VTISGFQYLRPASLDEALAAVASPGAALIGGGTDLVPRIEEGLAAPTAVVDVRHLPTARDIQLTADGALALGAAVRIADLADDATIRTRVPMLAEAAAAVGSPALRTMGTLAGNLAQRPRCWYYRRGVSCLKTGGTGCPAAAGEHPYHGIIDAGPCRAAHPSDPAVALLALDAMLEIATANGPRHVALADAYRDAATSPTAELAVGPNDLITRILIPADALDGVTAWEKVMQRGAFDFALVSCAALRRTDGSVHLVLGGVGAAPWRVPHSIEEDVASGGLDDESIDALAARALYDVTPLPGTAYKVRIAEGVLRRAIRAIAP
jgi:xanthine dehydrogenase YagS FAD-binding subunit